MALPDKYGYYHATNESGYISWYDFTRKIHHQVGYDTKVIPVTTEESDSRKQIVFGTLRRRRKGVDSSV